MDIPGIIISKQAKRLHTFTAADTRSAEAQAREWASQNGAKVVSDIISQGVYRAWVEPIAPGRLATLTQIAATNGRMQEAA